MQTRSTILIVDDDLEVRSLLNEILRSKGFRTLESPNAHKAIDVIEREDVDLMLLDIYMTGGTGVDLLRALRRRAVIVPVIVVSAYVSEIVARTLVDLGVMGILAKPFLPNRLVREIRHALDRLESPTNVPGPRFDGRDSVGAVPV